MSGAQTITLAEQLCVVELLERPEPRLVVGPFTAIRIVAALYSIEENALLSRRRDPLLVEARALVAWVLRTVPTQPMSYPKIARALNKQHHTSAIHLHLMAIKLRLEDEIFARRCTALETYFKQMEKAHGRIPAFD
jgi:chromosomal replication initiation ATPase DnaA